MPEAPTILVLCEKTKKFIGKKVVRAEGSVYKSLLEKIEGENVINVRTYGKQLIISFPDFAISVHLMLFGSFTIDSDKPGKLTLGLTFDKGNLNFYASKVRLIERPLEEEFDFSVEVMNEQFDKKLALKNLQKHPELPIVDALIDQDSFAGVGNKIRNEVLYQVKVHPLSKVKDLPTAKLKEIIDDCVAFSFQMLEWKRKEVMDENLLIYKAKECPKDKTPVTAEKLGSRVIYYCGKCQKLY